MRAAEIRQSYRYLFLDRDGVINRRLIGDYVKSPLEFEFETGASEAIASFSGQFERILVVTNQRGVGVGLMSEEDLQLVHAHMLEGLAKDGGKIDAIYFAPYDRDESHFRKPGIGMPLQAREDYPEINFERSIMVGDSLSDMQMGRKLGMLCVKISPEGLVSGDWDLQFASLAEFAAFLEWT